VSRRYRAEQRAYAQPLSTFLHRESARENEREREREREIDRSGGMEGGREGGVSLSKTDGKRKRGGFKKRERKRAGFP